MTERELRKALSWLKVETGSLACLGCGYEKNCGTAGCRILREVEALIAETPPVKIGDVVWFLLKDFPRFHPKTKGWYIKAAEVTAISTVGFSVERDPEMCWIPYDSIGDECYLTCAAAENALRKVVRRNG